MHPARDLVGRGRPLQKLIQLEAILRALLLRIEALADRPDASEGRPDRDAGGSPTLKSPATPELSQQSVE